MSLSFKGFYRFGEFELDPARRSLSRGGVPVSVSPRAFEVLTYLVANSGRVVTKEEVLRAVWPDSFVEESNLPQHVSALRKALADRADCIVTIPGRGYQFTAKVQTETPSDSAPLADLAPLTLQTVRESAHIVFTETSTQIPATPRQTFPRWPLWVAASAAILAAYFLLRSFHAAPLSISTYTQITHDGHPKFIGGTDGSRVYFTREDAAGIAEVSVSGGAVAPIPVELKDPWAGDVSPDGSRLLVISEAGGQGPADSLWSLQVVGGSLRRLTNAIASAWSPDGSKIAYATTNGDVYLMLSDGSDANRIASPGGYLKCLAWSPNGKLLRFSKGGHLWEMSATGTNLHQLLPGWGRSPTEWSGAWASDGRFYFVADGQIWLLDERHSLSGNLPAKPLQLTFGPIVWERPIPSPDGKRLFASGRSNRGELVRFDAQSSRFQPFLAGISAEFVTFSADGKSVAYVSYPDGVLWRANSDGSNPTQLTDPPTYPKSLRWSPDGAQILFVDRTPLGPDAIYIVPADGSTKPRRLLPTDTQAETDPSWSPDGRRIAFSTSPNVGASARSDLRILDLTTGKAELIPASDGLLVPHWSPDGLTISAMTLDTMGMRLFSVSSGKWTKLDTGAVAFPEWSHDGRSIYYVRWTSDPALLRIRIADGKRETLADLKGARYTGVYTLWMGLDPADTPLMLRDAGTDDIYALTLEKK